MDLIEYKNTACPRNCYSTCGFKVAVKNGKIGLIEPDKSNNATSEGICLKGLSYAERVYHPERIVYPIKRIKDKHFRISWEEAIDIIVDEILHIQEKYSPQSILYYSGSGTKGLLNSIGANFWELTGGYTSTYGDLCWMAGLEATRLLLGDNKHNAPWDIKNSKLIIIWGKNSAETNVHQMKFIDEAINKGAKLVVIDSRKTETADKAHLFIQPKPGTDSAIAIAVAKLLIDNKQIDKEFISKYVIGFHEFKESIADIDVSTCSKLSQVSLEQIMLLAEWIGTIKPATINAGFGMQRYTNGGQTFRSIISLLAITGNIGKPGAGWIYANLQSNIFTNMKDPIASFKPEKQTGNHRISISIAKLGEDILSTTDPPIKMIWVERGNPVTSNPDTNKVLKAFRSAEFRVVVDQFMTDTAKEADLILPAKTMFEQSDVLTAYWHPYIQLRQKIIDPPEEVKPESEIYYLLAKQLGFSDEDLEGVIPHPDDGSVEDFLDYKLAEFSNISLSKLRKGPQLPFNYEEIAFEDLTFNTPSGKIELLSEEASGRWNASRLPEISSTSVLIKETDRTFYMMTPNTKNRIHSQFGNLELIKNQDPQPFIHMHPDDALKFDISEYEIITISNERGELSAQVKFDNGLKKGCLSMSNGWWISQGGNVNFLSPGLETDFGHGAAFHDNLVEIKIL